MNYQIKQDLNRNIFRGYDVRGVYPTELDEDTAYTFGLGFGTHISNLGKDTCIVGHDNRLSSPALYDALIEGITSTGIPLIISRSFVIKSLITALLSPTPAINTIASTLPSITP